MADHLSQQEPPVDARHSDEDAPVIDQQTNAVVEQVPGVDKMTLHMLNDIFTASMGTGAPIGFLWGGARILQSDGGITFGENMLASLGFAALQPAWHHTVSTIFDRLLLRLNGTTGQVEWYRKVFATASKIVLDGSVLGGCIYAADKIAGDDAPLAKSVGSLTTAFALIGFINFVVDATMLKYTYQIMRAQNSWSTTVADWMKQNKDSIMSLEGLLDRGVKFGAFSTYSGTNIALKLIWKRAAVCEKYQAAFTIVDMIAFFAEFKAWEKLLAMLVDGLEQVVRIFGTNSAADLHVE